MNCGVVPLEPSFKNCQGCRAVFRAKSANSRASGYHQGWLEKNRDSQRAYHRSYQAQAQREVIEGYGARCRCCGETEWKFLTLDHVNGGGKQHRKRVSATQIYRNIIKAGFPPEFQVLCWNCHMAKDRRGGCPHQAARE